MLFSVTHPTARVRASESFPSGWRESMLDWFAKCDRPDRVEYVLSVHTSRWVEFWAGSLGPVTFPDWGRVTVVRNLGPDTNVSQVNAAAAACSGKMQVGNMDDLFPPEHWDTLLAEAVAPEGLEAAPDSLEVVLHCSTGGPRDWEPLINSGGITRARYLRFGYAVYPGYESMYADDELTAVAYRDGVVIQCPQILFNHRHWSVRKAVVDEVYAMQNRKEAYDRGRALFESRKSRDFPADWVDLPGWSRDAAVPAPRRVPPVVPIRKTVVACFPGSEFSDIWNAYTFKLLAMMMHEYSVFLPMWGYSSNVYIIRCSMLASLLAAPSKPDLVLWMDSDNLLTYEDFSMLAGDLEEHPDADMVAAWAWCRPNDYRTEQKISAGRADRSGKLKPLTLTDLQAAPGDLLPIEYTGFPAVLMRYSVLEKVGEGGFAPLVGTSHAWGFAGEDVSFCRRALDAGCKLFVDRRVRVPHLKRSTDDDEGLPVVFTQKVAAG